MNQYFLLLLSVCGASVGAAISVMSAFETQGRSKKTLAILAGCFAVGGAIASGVDAISSSHAKEEAERQQHIQQQHMLDAQGELATAQQKFNGSQHELRQRTDEVLRLSRENVQANRVITLKSDQLLNQATGGNAWARAAIGGFALDDNKREVFISNTGDVPLLNFRVTLLDSAKVVTMHDYRGVPFPVPESQVLVPGNDELSPRNQAQMYPFDLTGFDHRQVTIITDSRNSHVVQNFSMRRVEGHWKVAATIDGKAGQKKIHIVEIPKDFPKNAKGELLW